MGSEPQPLLRFSHFLLSGSRPLALGIGQQLLPWVLTESRTCPLRQCHGDRSDSGSLKTALTLPLGKT